MFDAGTVMIQYKVIVAQLKHETNTFNIIETDLNAYRQRQLEIGDDMLKNLANTGTEVGGFIQAAKKFDWVLLPTLAADATPGGRITRECWFSLTEILFSKIESGGNVDGILLSLHGAMATEEFDDADGELLSLIRHRVGQDVPIVATIDMHANVTQRMVENASALVAFRTYPHIDHVDRALQAAELLQTLMQKRVRARTVVVRAPLLAGVDHGRTHRTPEVAGPMDRILDLAREHESRNDILIVNVCAGFAWQDHYDAGPSVAVTYDGDGRQALSIASAIMAQYWQYRGLDTVPWLTVDQALAEISRSQDYPVVIADFSDNPGGGGYGDATGLLGALLESGMSETCFHAINDPETVKTGIAAGLGANVTVSLGGKIDPRYGAPLLVTGRVQNLTDGRFVCDGPMYEGMELCHGPTMVLNAGGTEIVITSHRLQTTDLQSFRSQGIDPSTRRIVVVKSLQHFRAAFAPIARRIMLVNSGGICNPDYSAFKYTKIRRPVFPLDRVDDDLPHEELSSSWPVSANYTNLR